MIINGIFEDAVAKKLFVPDDILSQLDCYKRMFVMFIFLNIKLL
jgi:hypothetical protein